MPQLTPESLANIATRALLYEVSVNPKPGLVDPVSSGPHPDMSVFTFIDSSLSIQPYLLICAKTGESWTAALPELFQMLRPAGVKAEQAMFATTNGVNTHKGAIFSLGIMVAAVAYQQVHRHDYSVVRSVIQAMLDGLTKHDFVETRQKSEGEWTVGEHLYVDYGLTGVRGEAEAGYPVVFETGLPALHAASGTLNERLLDTLMAIAAGFADTNLIHRAQSPAILPWAQAQAQDVLDAGGCWTPAGQAALTQMNQAFLTKHLSLGGSADMLILTIFMALVKGDI